MFLELKAWLFHASPYAFQGKQDSSVGHVTHETLGPAVSQAARDDEGRTQLGCDEL